MKDEEEGLGGTEDVYRKLSGVMGEEGQDPNAWLPLEPRAERMPKRRNTSEQVTRMDRRIRMIMIHVRPAGIVHVKMLVVKGLNSGNEGEKVCGLSRGRGSGSGGMVD